MDRRDFIKAGAATVVAAELAHIPSFAQTQTKEKPYMGPWSCENAVAGPEDLSVRFLGTGSSGWYKDKTRRAHTSLLVERKVLIDYSYPASLNMPADCHPEVIFYTHSHGDHFEPETAIKAGLKRVYLSETWLKHALNAFRKASDETGLPMPAVIPIAVGEKVTVEGIDFTALPANHATSYPEEQALIYLVEKGTTAEKLGVRLLYATDTGGIMGEAGRLSGIDPHIKPGRPITAFIMEATIGLDMEEDWRIFNHSTIASVARTVHMVQNYERYLPPEGQPAYLTHMSKAGWPATQDELQRRLPAPLRAAYDGLDVVFKAR